MSVLNFKCCLAKIIWAECERLCQRCHHSLSDSCGQLHASAKISWALLESRGRSLQPFKTLSPVKLQDLQLKKPLKALTVLFSGHCQSPDSCFSMENAPELGSPRFWEGWTEMVANHHSRKEDWALRQNINSEFHSGACISSLPVLLALQGSCHSSFLFQPGRSKPWTGFFRSLVCWS